jgi:SAM-dependent methyltransferase
MSDAETRAFWDNIWSDEDAISYWRDMSAEVVAIAELESPEVRPNVLDVGCGAGRNVIAFSKKGFKVTACDISPKAIELTRSWAQKIGVRVHTVLTSATRDTFPAEAFDIVTAINVLYHATKGDFEKAVRNILKWMKKGAIFYFTCPSLEDSQYYNAAEIAPNTFELEPGHIHYCLDFKMLTQLLSGNQIVSLHRCEHHYRLNNEWKTSSRWRVLAKKT